MHFYWAVYIDLVIDRWEISGYIWSFLEHTKLWALPLLQFFDCHCPLLWTKTQFFPGFGCRGGPLFQLVKVTGSPPIHSQRPVRAWFFKPNVRQENMSSIFITFKLRFHGYSPPFFLLPFQYWYWIYVFTHARQVLYQWARSLCCFSVVECGLIKFPS